MKFLFEYRRYRLPFRVPVRTAHGVWTEREGLLVRVAGVGGVAGFGEVAPVEWFGSETVDAAEEVCRGLGDRVEEGVADGLPERFACVKFALRTALAEARGDVLGEAKHAALPVAALLPAGRAALGVAAQKAEAGFRTFKWKVGVGDAADELVLLDDLIAALPGGAKLRLDANGAWDRRRAERWLERCAERPVEFVEQPVAAEAKGAEDLLLGLAGDFPTAIALDESVAGEGEVARWLGLGWPGFYVLKPVLLGDAAGAVARLEAARAKVVFSSALETAVGAKAALRLAFAQGGEPRALGFGVWPLFAEARCDGPHAAPFVRWQDVAAINPEAAWNALG